ncbi:MAG: right-handed parallel beta-helix repeat-containing protein [Eubacterium sp.]|nr:right-handed parallel beta-helix repeat-containing protein [Eubacterium sp.]
MTVINAAEYKIVPDSHVGSALAALFNKLSEIDGEKALVFESGNYYIDAAELEYEMLYITNTVGDKEFKKGEIPHRVRTALNLKNIKDLRIEGNGAKFIVCGTATNAALQHCENIEINDIEIDVENPDMHEMAVIAKGKHFVDFQIDACSTYSVEGGKLYFNGVDYKTDALKKYRAAWHTGCVKKDTPNTIKRTHHLFLSAIKAKDLGDGKVRIYYLNNSQIEIGDRYYVFHNRRDNVGIFIDFCKDITLNSVSQRFNYSLAIVAQNTENITLNKLDFSPNKNSGRLVASTADFIQICMCKGKVTVENSYFDGACDDCINVHGVHFKIKSIEANKITVQFMHPQAHGFNPIHLGDEIAFINPATMLECGRATAISSKLINEYQLEIALDNTENAKIGHCIEDVTMCPELEFKNNVMTRIITRGILLTTRGKSVIESNRFVSTSMSGILLSDDASSWYESGMCCDVTIKDNVFEHCADHAILIKPENVIHSGAVHKNIKIIGNEFKDYGDTCMNIKSSSDIEISGNTFANDNRLTVKNCENIVKDF